MRSFRRYSARVLPTLALARKFLISNAGLVFAFMSPQPFMQSIVQFEELLQAERTGRVVNSEHTRMYGHAIFIPSAFERSGPRGQQLLMDVSKFISELLSEREDIERAILDRKSTRLNSSHLGISYAVFCLKKK